MLSTGMSPSNGACLHAFRDTARGWPAQVPRPLLLLSGQPACGGSLMLGHRPAVCQKEIQAEPENS